MGLGLGGGLFAFAAAAAEPATITFKAPFSPASALPPKGTRPTGCTHRLTTLIIVPDIAISSPVASFPGLLSVMSIMRLHDSCVI